MKKGILFFLLFHFATYINAQSKLTKPPIDTGTFRTWPAVGSAIISDNGKYVMYNLENVPIGSQTLIVQSSDAKWKMEIIGGPSIFSCLITRDSKYAIFKKKNDSLNIISLGDSIVELVPNVQSFKVPEDANDKWIAYKTNNDELVVRDLKSGSRQKYASIVEYLFDKSGKVLLLNFSGRNGDRETQFLTWLNLSNGKETSIWKGSNASNYVFDCMGSQLAFKSVHKKNEVTVWYYHINDSIAQSLLTNNSKYIDTSLLIENLVGFTKDGQGLLLNFKKEKLPKSSNNAVQVNVWSYKDVKLKSQQLDEIFSNRYLALFKIHQKWLYRLQNEYETLIRFDPNDVRGYILVLNESNKYKYDSSKGDKSSIYLVSTLDASRILLNDEIKKYEWITYRLTPSNKIVLFSDALQRNYFSYEISSKKIRNITKSLPIPLFNEEYDETPGSKPRGLSIGGWSEAGNSVVIYDVFDIWLVDLLEKKKPISITNGFGRKNGIVFRISEKEETFFSPKRKVIAIAFNTRTKDNGFYRVCMNNNKRDPDLISMSAKAIYIPIAQAGVDGGRMPIRAKNSEKYILSSGDASESVNYYYTSNFKRMVQLTFVYPEAKYNWLTTELHTWKKSDGRYLQGVLYKPEDFDKTRRYPVILYYYQKLSEGLNVYLSPKASDGRLNISWYVSNGYLVFTPDIFYEIGQPGASAYDCVISAAKYLSKFKFIDSSKMGIQGMSHGGFETNYIVTNTGIFAAACSASAASDLVSMYGSLTGNRVNHEYYESGQGRIGATLWDRPDLYISNSPIFKPHKVTTPLLMFHTTVDYAVPFSQAMEFFTALHRLKKKVWLLQYNEGNHGVAGKSALDFSIRMSQFFNYYLKGYSPPEWMTKDGQTYNKENDELLDLDNSGREP